MKTSHPSQGYTRWNLPEGAKARLGTGAINDIQFSPDGTRLAVASSIGIWIYDAHTGEELNLLTGHKGSVSSIAYSPNGHLLASGSRDDTVRLWDAKRGMPLKTLRIYAFQSFGVYSVAFQNDGRILASGGCTDVIFEGTQMVGEEHGVFLWKAEIDLSETKHGLRTVPRDVLIKTLQHKGFAKSVAFSSDGYHLASGSENGTVRLWDTKSGELLKTLNMPESLLTDTKAVESIAFCGDGRILASGAGWKIWLWDVERGKLLKTLRVFLGGAYSVCFSPDRRILARSGSLNNISLWDIAAGKPLKTLPHTDMSNVNVTSLAFSADGRTLASGSQDGTVLLWDVDIVTNKKSIIEPAPITPSVSTPNTVAGRDKVILGEKKPEFQNRESQIHQICTERGITTLVHFTRVENLQSILQEGLIDRSLLEARRQQFLFNDPDRADGHKEAVCLSISFPNYQMFYSIRKRKKETEGLDDAQWVILLLDVKVLWELDCAFCQENAARKAVSTTPLEVRKGPEGLKGMFGDFYDIRHQDLPIPNPYLTHPKDAYPTHPQAEVLVLDSIGIQYIKAIHFWNETTLEKWCPNYGNSQIFSLISNISRQDLTMKYGDLQILTTRVHLFPTLLRTILTTFLFQFQSMRMTYLFRS